MPLSNCQNDKFILPMRQQVFGAWLKEQIEKCEMTQGESTTSTHPTTTQKPTAPMSVQCLHLAPRRGRLFVDTALSANSR